MKEQVTVWFEGLGLEPFSLNKVAFTLFGKFEVRWYAIMILIGMIFAYIVARYHGKHHEGIKEDDVIDVAFLTIFLGILGARAYYVLTSRDQYFPVTDWKSFVNLFAIWEGGLAIYGGIIGGALGLFIMCAIKKLDWRKLFDMAAPGVMLAQAIGRWGNFFNGEAYGSEIGETTQYFFFLREHQLPSGEGTLFHTLRMGLYPNDISPFYTVFVHPTFLYECVWNLLGFLFISLFYKHKKYNGQIVVMYLTWYGFGRMFIEGFRTDSLYILKGVVSDAGLRVSQCVGLACFALGLLTLIVMAIRVRMPGAAVSVVETPPLAYPAAKADAETEAARDEQTVNALLDGKLVESVRKITSGEELDEPDEADEQAVPETPEQPEGNNENAD